MAEQRRDEIVLPPIPMSEPCLRFFQDQFRIYRYFSFVGNLAQKVDELGRIGGSAFFIIATDEQIESKGMQYEQMKERGLGATEILAAYEQFVRQMLLCRAVDNYLTYISETIALIFRTRPETMKSGDTIKFDMILEHKTMEDLISALVDRRVNELSYQGMSALTDYLAKRLNFKLFELAEDLNHAIRIIEVRNIIVHNRAVVNRVLLSRLPDFPAKLGETVKLEGSPFFKDMEFLARSAVDIDLRGSSKFGFPQPVSEENMSWDM